MLYLEDYLEMMETLPQELRDRFTEIRELDLKVQNTTDLLQSRIKLFFANARKMKPSERQEEYDAIQLHYHKSLEDADDKVNISSLMYDLVDKYIRRLDQELHKFKMELEADNAGITEILERRSLELDNPETANNKVKEVSYRTSRVSTEKRQLSVDKKEAVKVEPVHMVSALSDSTSAAYMGFMGVGSNALAAAASQAITATQQMQQGRRTASLKASYEAVNAGVYNQDFNLSRELSAVSSRPTTPVQQGPPEKKIKKRTALPPPPSPALSEELVGDTIIDTNLDLADWSYDPNEPKYCVCNQVSYGDMVACDNSECVLEWFHYSCVGITAPPKGKWYCPQCTASVHTTTQHKKRGARR